MGCEAAKTAGERSTRSENCSGKRPIACDNFMQTFQSLHEPSEMRRKWTRDMRQGHVMIGCVSVAPRVS